MTKLDVSAEAEFYAEDDSHLSTETLDGRPLYAVPAVIMEYDHRWKDTPTGIDWFRLERRCELLSLTPAKKGDRLKCDKETELVYVGAKP